MPAATYKYAIIGGSLAGGSAVQGIREHDKDGSIVMVGHETYAPYNRPPLTKGLWFGKKTVDQIFVQNLDYYSENKVEMWLDTDAREIDPYQHLVTDSRGRQFHYEKLLLATGGTPRKLDIPGGDLDGICYYRYLDDYKMIRAAATPGASAVIVGGGFIGSELAAGLCHNGVKVTMIFPDAYLVSRVFPEGLGKALTTMFQQRGITMLTNDTPAAFSREGDRFVTNTKNGQQITSDILIVGVGITPTVDLAQQAKLAVANGIVVNEYLQSSDPDIFAAGDNAYFPYQALGKQSRVKHWDNALNQGLYAGRNMAGANQQYDYMPYFFSDLFEFGYEAVGDVIAKLETFADWQKENDTGVIYYLQDGRVRGAMMCNIYGQVDAVRELIKRGEQVTPEQLRGAIKPPQHKDQAA